MSPRLQTLLRPFLAGSAPVSTAERWRSTLAGFAGVLLAAAILIVLPLPAQYRYLLAPMGATSVILFSLPHSPLAQPWPVLGGLTVSTLAGLLCAHWLPWPPLAMASAVGLSIFLMAWLRCLHPPGGAMALIAVLSAQPALPVAVLATLGCNLLAIFVAVIAVNNLVPGRHYPQSQPPAPSRRPAPARRSIAHEDLQAALDEIDAYLDISEDDLVDVYNRASEHAFRRHVRLRCADLMTPAPVTADFATELNTAWGLLRTHRIQSLPVIDRSQRVIGLLSIEDFVGHLAPDPGVALGDNLRRLLRPSPGMSSQKVEVVGQIMRSAGDDIVVAAVDDDLAATAASLGRRHQHTVPVVDHERRLVGILTQGDVIGGLFRQLALNGSQQVLTGR